MLFVLRLTVRLLVLPNAGDGTKDLEILVLRHHLRVLRRKSGRPQVHRTRRVLLAAASRALPRQRWRCCQDGRATVEPSWLAAAAIRSS